MDLSKKVNWRYSTKEFQKEKLIPSDTWTQIEEAMRMSASSTNAQPWHFIIASTKEGKEAMAKGTEKFPFNTQKILDASHVVLFCTKTTLSEEYLLHVLDKEDKDGRYADQSFKDQMHAGRSMFANFHKDDFNDLIHWNEKQVYLNVGSALLGAAVLGVDALPMEGIDIPTLNEVFGLDEKELTASVMVSFGYRTEGDFNAKLPKSRLEESEIFTMI